MRLLEINHIKKSFSTTAVLKDISLKVDEGEVVSIIGPSGSGKSTILRCATMLETMDRGDLILAGDYAAKDDGTRSVYAPSKELKRIQSVYGLVFQSFNLFPHMSVIQNVTDAPIHVGKVPKDIAEKEAMEILEKLGLSEKANSYPCELSGGQQQRVSIARALALKPRLLFFDEPTSALDPELTKDVLEVIKELAREHMTMVIVTHEMMFAKEVSDRIVFLEKGYVVQEGTPDELFNSENSRVREFIGKLTN